MKNDGIVIMVGLLKLVQHVLCGIRIEKLEERLGLAQHSEPLRVKRFEKFINSAVTYQYLNLTLHINHW